MTPGLLLCRSEGRGGVSSLQLDIVLLFYWWALNCVSDTSSQHKNKQDVKILCWSINTLFDMQDEGRQMILFQ